MERPYTLATRPERALLRARLKRRPSPRLPPRLFSGVKFIWWLWKVPPSPSQPLSAGEKKGADTWWIRSWLICCFLLPRSDRASEKAHEGCRQQRIQMSPALLSGSGGGTRIQRVTETSFGRETHFWWDTIFLFTTFFTLLSSSFGKWTVKRSNTL